MKHNIIHDYLTNKVLIVKIFLPIYLIMMVANVSLAEVGRIELHAFNSVTLSDQEFLSGKKHGRPVTITGELRLPRKKAKHYPVIVLVHGSGGVSGYVDDWAKEFNAQGIAVFILDSFTGRGLYKVNKDQGKLGRLAMIPDVYHAISLLSKHKHIDSKRIAVMGFSRGGQVALYSSLKRFQRLHFPEGNNNAHAAAYIAFYPACNTRYKNDNQIVNRPVRIFHGSADNYNPVKPCREYVKRLKNAGTDIILHEYAKAHHVFDYKKIKKPFIYKGAQTTRACSLKESDDGIIINAKSKKKFTYKDPCVQHDPTLAFNKVAYTKAKQELFEFVGNLFETRK